MAKPTAQSTNLTSYFFVDVPATPAELMRLFPESFDGDNCGDDKVNISFKLETEDGRVFTMYDWKYYRPLDMDETVYWHIGGFDEESTVQGAKEVCDLLGRDFVTSTNYLKIVLDKAVQL